MSIETRVEALEAAVFTDAFTEWKREGDYLTRTGDHKWIIPPRAEYLDWLSEWAPTTREGQSSELHLYRIFSPLPKPVTPVTDRWLRDGDYMVRQGDREWCVPRGAEYHTVAGLWIKSDNATRASGRLSYRILVSEFKDLKREEEVTETSFFKQLDAETWKAQALRQGAEANRLDRQLRTVDEARKSALADLYRMQGSRDAAIRECDTMRASRNSEHACVEELKVQLKAAEQGREDSGFRCQSLTLDLERVTKQRDAAWTELKETKLSHDAVCRELKETKLSHDAIQQSLNNRIGHVLEERETALSALRNRTTELGAAEYKVGVLEKEVAGLKNRRPKLVPFNLKRFISGVTTCFYRDWAPAVNVRCEDTGAQPVRSVTEDGWLREHYIDGVFMRGRTACSADLMMLE